MSSAVPPAAPSGASHATPSIGVAPFPASVAAAPSARDALAVRIDALLPQTQCTRCGYPDCRAYAEALADGAAELNRCPPGGDEGVRRLARLLDRPIRPLAPEHGEEGPRRVAFIDESRCIGCTLCIQACPVDAIIGAPKRMHAIVEPACTGCELCVPACPVDCIVLEDASGAATGWDAWSPARAEDARTRYVRHAARLARDEQARQQRLAAIAAARDARAAQPRGDAPDTARTGDPTLAPSAADHPDPASAARAAQVRPLTPPGLPGEPHDTTDAPAPESTIPTSPTSPHGATPPGADTAPIDPKRAAIEAALARARLRAKMRAP